MRQQVTTLFVFCALVSIVPVCYISFGNHRILISKRRYSLDGSSEKSQSIPSSSNSKTILLWTIPESESFAFKGLSEDGYKPRCTYDNCVVTANRTFLSDVTEYDVIVFYAPDLFPIPKGELPKRRSPHQKYVFASRESSHYYPLCMEVFDGFFNWTWTYRLDSDIDWSYLAIKDKNNTVIGPSKTMHWEKLEDMKSVSEEFKAQLKLKNKAVAWFVTNCGDRSGRKIFANNLQTQLAKYNLTIDVYGKCGTLKCGPFKPEQRCDQLIMSYHFYLAFENSFSEDYVTEKLLRALQFNTVPVVYGYANYTRFMPDGIYLNGKALGSQALADKMYHLINTPEEYASYFKWKNHYSYHSKYDDSENDDYCKFCTIVNNKQKMENQTIVQDFQKWWDNPDLC